MDLNLVVLSGRLAADPEVREFESGSRLVRYLVTVRAEEPGRRLDVVPVTRWNPTPDEEARVRGDRLWITGAVQRRFLTAHEGRRSALEIIATHVTLREEPEPAAIESDPE